MFLTKEIIQRESIPHPVINGGRMFTKEIGDYTLSIVGGCRGPYGDFDKDFEVTIIDNNTGEFEPVFLKGQNNSVDTYVSIEDINKIISKIPR